MTRGEEDGDAVTGAGGLEGGLGAVTGGVTGGGQLQARTGHEGHHQEEKDPGGSDEDIPAGDKAGPELEPPEDDAADENSNHGAKSF